MSVMSFKHDLFRAAKKGMSELAETRDPGIVEATKEVSIPWIVTPHGLICAEVKGESASQRAGLVVRWAAALGLGTVSLEQGKLKYAGKLDGWSIEITGVVEVERFDAPALAGKAAV